MTAADPGRLGGKIRASDREIRRRVRRIEAAIAEIVGQVQYTVSVTNSYGVNRSAYTYQLDEQLYKRITSEFDALLSAAWLQGGEQSLWIMTQFVAPAYAQGAAQAIAQLKSQSAALKTTGPAIEQLIYQPAYQRRLALVRARLFEEMKGLTDTMRTDLAETLARSMASGKGVREVVKDVQRRVGVGESRARRIARTEIGTAHKQATLDESDDMAEQYDLRVMMMQLSAFAATSRPSHMARHGNLYTSDEVRRWLAMDANAVSCLCAFTSVVVDDNNQPISPAIMRRAREIKQRMQNNVNACTCAH